MMLNDIKENVSLAPYTVFKIGGKARFFIEAKSRDVLVDALKRASGEKLNVLVAGAGSNILIADKGFDGLYIKNGANKFIVEGEKIFADSGMMMPYLASIAAKAGLSGLEWGIGIPGTLGGSIRGNAGCFGKEIKDVVSDVDVFDLESGKEIKFSNKECGFGYRSSLFKERPNFVVIAATILLSEKDAEKINYAMRELSSNRADTQDIGAKCAGCIFKNVPWTRKDINKEALIGRFPELWRFEALPGIPAGFLIDESGLKGKRVGGAMISRKHANFIINESEARAEDIVILIVIAKEYVQRKFGVFLEEEIQYVGF